MLLLATRLTSCYAQCALPPLQFPVAPRCAAARPRTEAGRLAEYRLLSKKGEGTFSEVLKAQCLRTAKYVAIKGAPALHQQCLQLRCLGGGSLKRCLARHSYEEPLRLAGAGLSRLPVCRALLCALREAPR